MRPISTIPLMFCLALTLTILGTGGPLPAQMSETDFEYGGIIQAIEEEIVELRKAAVDDNKEAFGQKLEQLSRLLKELKDRKQAADEANNEVHVSEIVTKEGHVFRLTSRGGKVVATEVLSEQPDEIAVESPPIDTTVVPSETVPIDVIEADAPRPTRLTSPRRRSPAPSQPAHPPTARTTTPRVQRRTTYYLGGKEQELEDRLLSQPGNSGLVTLMRFEKVKLLKDRRMHDQAAAELRKIIDSGGPDIVEEAARWTLVEILQEQNNKREAIRELEAIVTSRCSRKVKKDALYGIINLSGTDPETKIEVIDDLIRKLQQSERRFYDPSLMPGELPTPAGPAMPPPGLPEPTPMAPSSTFPELPGEPSMPTPPAATYLAPALTMPEPSPTGLPSITPEPPVALPTPTPGASPVTLPSPSGVVTTEPNAAPSLVPPPAILPTTPSPAPRSD